MSKTPPKPLPSPRSPRWQLPPALLWVSATLVVVLLWGWLDPFAFGIIQKADWIVQDQFLRDRPPAPMHPDLLQVSLDDYAAIQLGKNTQRRQIARAIRQLKQLGAKTVLVDVLFFGRGSSESVNRDDLIDYEGIPIDIAQHITELPNRFLEDQMLAVSLADFDRVVIPFHLRDADGQEDDASRSILNAMVDRLEQNNSLDVTELASEFNIQDLNKATRLYKPACAVVADHIALEPDLDAMAKLLKPYPNMEPAELARRLKIDLQTSRRLYDSAFTLAFDRRLRDPIYFKQHIGGSRSAVTIRVPMAVDRRTVLDHVHEIGTFELQDQPSVETTDDLEVPLSDFAADAVLGFADFDPDSDGTYRRIPLVKMWDDRCVTHQSLAAVAVHLGVKLSDLRIDDRTIRIDSKHVVPIDATGRLSINWPMNGEKGSHKKLPQLSFGDLLELAKYDSDLKKTQLNLRFNVAVLENQLELDIPVDETSDSLLDAIYEDYFTGRFDAAQEKERLFDDKYFDDNDIPRVLSHEKAQAILSSVNGTPRERTDAEKEFLITVESIVAIQKEIGRIVKARDDQIQRIRKKVKGKLCLVGDTSTGSSDLKSTPVGPAVPGVTINLAAINSMLTGRYRVAPPVWAPPLLTLVIGASLSWVFLRVHVVASFAAAVAGLVLVYFGYYFALRWGDILASPVLPMLGVTGCYITVTTHRWWQEFRDKQQIREAFQHYLNPAMVEKVTRHPELLRLGGEDAGLSILFSDIRGFSSISENLTAEQLQKLLNGFLTPMTHAVHEHDGTLDKYIGDAMMAFFGAPLPIEDHPAQACRTALKMMQRLAELQQEWREQGLPGIQIGIGINTDTVRVGNFGSEMRFDYTVIGDGVNLASRLEGATKFYGVNILISENTFNRLNGEFLAREIDYIQVKGKDKPTRIFELVQPSSDEEQQREFLDRFESGITAYREQNWNEATEHFRQALAIDPDDSPCTIFIQRCEEFLASPPPDDWDSMYSMTLK